MKLPHTDEIPDELFEAARVSRFMHAESRGRWKLVPFTVTEDDFARNALKLQFGEKNEERVEMEMTRIVPPGDYITLSRKMIESEVRDVWFDNFGKYPEEFEQEFVDRVMPDSSRWIPVMSDTPAEIIEHYPAINGATGAVLITGLGLGCLPHALLEKPGITRIDIIEIDQDVIDLTAHYLADERVHIWRGSAADPNAVPADLTWDYAWHDIWTHISAKNLDDATAEHRISYQRLFDLWAPRVRGEQDGWAYPQAVEMRRIDLAEREAEREFRDRVRNARRDEQVELLYRAVLQSRVQGIGQIPEPLWPDIKRMVDPEGHLREHIEEQLDDPAFLAKLDDPIVDEESSRLGLPNEHLETLNER